MSNANDNPQAGQGRPLPKKDQDLFRTVVRHYETKQYKKGIKVADTILKRFPNHGETLCMKGLILNCTGKRDEAIAMVKTGLMKDMRSHVCWHVYGLIYRSERNYNEAIKAYKQALRIDKENIQILRDLSLLQIQMRDLTGFVKTRHTMLELKSNQKTNWLTFALSKHLIEDVKGAISIIDVYLETLDKDSPDVKKNYESSELALYRNMLIAEIPNNYQDALEDLKKCKHLVLDMHLWLTTKALYQLQLQKYHDAKETFELLLERGSTEDYSVHSGYMCAILQLSPPTCTRALKIKGARTIANTLPLTDDQKDILLKEYQNTLLDKYPKSAAVKRIPLTLFKCNSQEWKTSIESYMEKHLIRGVPSLGKDLASLILVEKEGEYVIATEPCDIVINPVYQNITSLVDGFVDSLETNGSFPNKEGKQPPSTLLWTWYLRSILHELAAHYSDAIKYIDKCLDQTPTAVDMYEVKGRLIKAAGDINSAAECLDKGRELDKQDRYINNQTVKYMLQAGKEDVALERMALFTRHESNPEQNIFDMQCYWYEMELAACHARKKNMGKSLKKYMAIEKHFEDFNDDQFDFHSYCIRKVTLRAYIDVLRWEDNLWGHDVYAQAAEGIIRNYLDLYHNPPKDTTEDAEPDYSKMTAVERKKAKAQARKRKKKAEKKAEEEAAEEKDSKKKSNDKSNPPKIKDTDPDGKELLAKDPLEEAKKYVATLVKNAPNRISTWLCQYDVAILRGKYFMALQALKKADKLESCSANHEVFSRLIEFSKLEIKVHKHAAVQKVFESERLALLDSKTLNDFVKDVVDKVKQNEFTCLSMRIAVAKAMLLIQVGSVKDACEIITVRGLNIHGVNIKSCRDSVEYLKSLDGDIDGTEESRDKWIELVKLRYFLSPHL